MAIAALGWTAVTLSAKPAESDKSGSKVDTAGADVIKMDHDVKEVQRRVNMAAPMELELENGVDPVAEAEKNGFIIEATLEQVEAALAAAAATPDTEDDKRALELRHRGSYRFFSPSVTGSSPSRSSGK